MAEQRSIIFFDGVCNLCNRFIDFSIRHDKKQTLHYSSLQSVFAQKFLHDRNIQVDKLSTIYYYHNSQLFSKSTAVLKIAQQFGLAYQLVAKALLLVNRSLRDWIYMKVSRNRYRFWGKRETCRLPSAAEQARFLE